MRMWKNTECIVAFPRQQWLRERATMLRYMYTACLVSICFVNPWIINLFFYSCILNLFCSLIVLSVSVQWQHFLELCSVEKIF